ncbi:class I SAM-dependent methyltransferase [Cryomorpha ignava]|uniref:Class I SAM-dependent methyltransferase n=1 Tax=Cryomorpha ignava TaxID=101383 RepID=A0A7K3WVD5_9FLAO|nr:class I SAM-dependent methyltransferase [Cryomorpha ignava]NEN25627.1 class I SAM-dependent methyltransferase [Cryomorpha ignava]
MSRYQETFSTWNKIAATYSAKFMELELYNTGYENFCNLLPKKEPEVLEIGCGPGNISKYIFSHIVDAEVVGIDVAPAMIEYAKLYNPAGSYYEMDARNIQMISKRFHGIVCGFCIPYLSKPDVKKLIKDCRQLLYSDGVLYLSFVDGKYAKSGFQTGSTGHRTYFYFHESDYILKCLNKCGFELIEKSTVNYNKTDGTKEEHTIMIARIV